jgi:hypothetical protein
VVPPFLILLGGWGAYLSAAFTVLTFLTALVFFAKGQPFGTINDVSSVLQVLFMIPLALALNRLLPAGVRIWVFLATAVGISGMLISALGQILLVFRRIDFEGSMKFFPAGAAIGVWLLVSSILALVTGMFPSGFAWVGILAGLGYLLTVTGFLTGGQKHPLFYLGGGVLVLSYPVWAIWLGHLLRNYL